MTDAESSATRGISRRALLGAAVAAAGAAAAPRALAQQQMKCAAVPAAGAKGPRVFLEYDQPELDANYDQLPWAPNFQQVTGRDASNSELVRLRIGAPRRVAYGPTEVERLDIYATVEQVRRAVAWVYLNAASFGGDAGRLHLSGHSSGSHLGGCVMITDWQRDFGLPAGVVKAALLVSGMYDLKAPRLSARSSYVKFTGEMEDALSAQRHLERVNAPIIVAHAALAMMGLAAP